MTFNSTIRSFKLALITATLSLGLFGCGSEDEAATTDSQAPEMVTREVPERSPAPSAADNGAQAQALSGSKDPRYRFIPKADGELAEDGDGLETIIDASSEQAFADSLRWIADNTSREQYSRLEQSIRFINAYDNEVLGDAGRMRRVLDGMTGNEVIERAKALSERRRNRG